MSMIKFRGSGINAAGIFTAVNNANDGLSKKTFPAGATWPLASLTIDDNFVEFRLAQIQKIVPISEVNKVSLNRIGYVLFHTRGQANDFGFSMLNIDRLLTELEKRHYPLDKTVAKNRNTAKVLLRVLLIISIVFVGSIITLSILKPNGF